MSAAVIEFRGPSIGVAGDPLSGFQSAVIFQKIRDAGRFKVLFEELFQLVVTGELLLLAAFLDCPVISGPCVRVSIAAKS